MGQLGWLLASIKAMNAILQLAKFELDPILDGATNNIC